MKYLKLSVIVILVISVLVFFCTGCGKKSDSVNGDDPSNSITSTDGSSNSEIYNENGTNKDNLNFGENSTETKNNNLSPDGDDNSSDNSSSQSSEIDYEDPNNWTEPVY